jgi:hypothetical protein
VRPESLTIIHSFKDHAMDQAVSRWPFTAQPRIQFQITPYENRGGQSVTETDFSLRLSVSPRHYHSTSAPYPSLSTCCSYQKDKKDKTGERVKKQCYFGNRGALDIKYFHLMFEGLDCARNIGTDTARLKFQVSGVRG